MACCGRGKLNDTFAKYQAPTRFECGSPCSSLVTDGTRGMVATTLSSKLDGEQVNQKMIRNKSLCNCAVHRRLEDILSIGSVICLCKSMLSQHTINKAT